MKAGDRVVFIKPMWSRSEGPGKDEEEELVPLKI